MNKTNGSENMKVSAEKSRHCSYTWPLSAIRNNDTVWHNQKINLNKKG